MLMTSVAKTAAIAAIVTTHRSRRDGVSIGKAAETAAAHRSLSTAVMSGEGICCRERVCQGGQSSRRCGIQADIAVSQRTAGQTRSVLSCKDGIRGAESTGENDASTAKKTEISAYEARLSRSLHRQAVSDKALHRRNYVMDAR